jgi:hypothetical protein
MKIAVYRKNGKLSNVYEGINNPRINGNDIYFEKGSFSCINDNHILLNDEDDVPDVLTDKLLAIDKKSTLSKFKTPKEENNQLKSRLESAELTIIALIDFMSAKGIITPKEVKEILVISRK